MEAIKTLAVIIISVILTLLSVIILFPIILIASIHQTYSVYHSFISHCMCEDDVLNDCNMNADVVKERLRRYIDE